jgi:Cd2+/Zn2+-exporting ATPase
LAIKEKATKTYEAINVKEIAGQGVAAEIDGKKVQVGNFKPKDFEERTTTVHIIINEEYAGYIEVEDVVKEESAKTVARLKKLGIKTFMLTGDNAKTAEKVAEQTKVWGYKAKLMPDNKVEEIEKLLINNSIAFVGDGINDAPSLARADVGIAMGGIGSDAAIEAADIVIMNDNIEKIPYVIALSKKTKTIVTENIVFAIGIKVLVMILSLINMGNMWIAVFADVGVSIIAIFNAVRIKK